MVAAGGVEGAVGVVWNSNHFFDVLGGGGEVFAIKDIRHRTQRFVTHAFPRGVLMLAE